MESASDFSDVSWCDVDLERIGHAAFANVHSTMLVVRRCMNGVGQRVHGGRQVVLGYCQRPATVSRRVDAGHRMYSCDACMVLFPPEGVYADLPHADVVRRYHRAALDKETLAATPAPDAIRMAADLVRALPPCPNVRIDFDLVDKLALAPNGPFLTAEQREALTASSIEKKEGGDGSAICARCAHVLVTPRPLVELDAFLEAATPRIAQLLGEAP